MVVVLYASITILKNPLLTSINHNSIHYNKEHSTYILTYTPHPRQQNLRVLIKGEAGRSGIDVTSLAADWREDERGCGTGYNYTITSVVRDVCEREKDN